jgi:integrase
VAWRAAAYLKRNRFGVFYYRRVLPPDVRKFFAFTEVARSLKTGSLGEAACLARRYGASLDFLFDQLRTVASHKKDKEVLRTDLIVALDFERDGTLKAFKTQIEPGEEEAASRIAPQLLQVARGLGAFQEPGKPAGPSLFVEIDKYLEELERGGRLTSQTVMDIKGDFEQFKQVLGDMPASALKHEPLNRLKDVLLRLPANINKLRETRGKTIDEILALGLPAQSVGTVKKKWDRLTSFAGWLEGKGILDKNYARGKKPKGQAQSYEKYTRDDLARLFGTDQYRSGKFDEPFQYWLPFLGLHTGARLEELAQLHLADVVRDAETGIWAIKITKEVDDEAGANTAKRTKNDSSVRTCPVHSAVLAAGFLEYVAELRDRGYDRLFPELVTDSIGKVSPRASEWFTAYRRSCNVGTMTGKSSKTFHSFRGTLNTALQHAGVRQEIREAICGHAHQAINLRVYGDAHLLTHLKEAIERVNFSLGVQPFALLEAHEGARRKARIRRASKE